MAGRWRAGRFCRCVPAPRTAVDRSAGAARASGQRRWLGLAFQQLGGGGQPGQPADSVAAGLGPRPRRGHAPAHCRHLARRRLGCCCGVTPGAQGHQGGCSLDRITLSMSESQPIPSQASVPDDAPVLERALMPAQAQPVLPDAWRVPRKWALLVLALIAAALLASGLLWQKLGSIQEELARRSTDSGAQAIEARTLAREAQEGMRALSARLAILETRISEVSLQRTQLEELMQSLSRSRDENLVVDIESALRLAQQQAQLTGSAQPLLAALASADQRLSRAAQPRLNPLQRAITRDMDRIKAASLTDVPVLLLKLDELSR